MPKNEAKEFLEKYKFHGDEYVGTLSEGYVAPQGYEIEVPDLAGSISDIRDMSSQNGDVGSMRPEFELDPITNQIGMKIFDRDDPNKVLAYVQNDGVVYQTPEGHYLSEDMADHYGQKKNHSDGTHSLSMSLGGSFRALADSLGFDGEFGIQGTFAKKDGSEGADSDPTDAKPIILDRRQADHS